jgi:hypothetical protein
MTTFSRVLPFDEYLAASRVANLHSTLGRRIRYITFLRVLPALAIVVVPLAIWLASVPGRNRETMVALLG